MFDCALLGAYMCVCSIQSHNAFDELLLALNISNGLYLCVHGIFCELRYRYVNYEIHTNHLQACITLIIGFQVLNLITMTKRELMKNWLICKSDKSIIDACAWCVWFHIFGWCFFGVIVLFVCMDFLCRCGWYTSKLSNIYLHLFIKCCKVIWSIALKCFYYKTFSPFSSFGFSLSSFACHTRASNHQKLINVIDSMRQRI